MATQTKPRRASSAPQGRFARGAATKRGHGPHRRRPPEPTGLKKVLSGILPGAAAKQAAPNTKKGAVGGIALVAAGAGLVFKKRDKLAQLRHRRSGTPPATSSETVVPPTNDANRSPAL
jgi:hypothetical protein